MPLTLAQKVAMRAAIDADPVEALVEYNRYFNTINISGYYPGVTKADARIIDDAIMGVRITMRDHKLKEAKV